MTPTPTHAQVLKELKSKMVQDPLHPGWLSWNRTITREQMLEALEGAIAIHELATTADDVVTERVLRLAEQGGWVGFDFDGTLAMFGDMYATPIPAMVERVKKLRAAKVAVKVVTARAGSSEGIAGVAEWCRHHIGEVLPVTDRKDFQMIELWDDRAVQVITNTGRRAYQLESAPMMARILMALWAWYDSFPENIRPPPPDPTRRRLFGPFSEAVDELFRLVREWRGREPDPARLGLKLAEPAMGAQDGGSR